MTVALPPVSGTDLALLPDGRLLHYCLGMVTSSHSDVPCERLR